MPGPWPTQQEEPVDSVSQSFVQYDQSSGEPIGGARALALIDAQRACPVHDTIVAPPEPLFLPKARTRSQPAAARPRAVQRSRPDRAAAPARYQQQLATPGGDEPRSPDLPSPAPALLRARCSCRSPSSRQTCWTRRPNRSMTPPWPSNRTTWSSTSTGHARWCLTTCAPTPERAHAQRQICQRPMST
ncbi:hypothetical protein PPS11_34418 [Pseudomonas putida S11]|nr:hypothetical protein PPS11_34418 [Pseudomonas putida S11]